MDQTREVERLREEIRGLRAALAYEAAVLEAQTEGVKALGKSRAAILARSVDRMRRSAVGQYAYYGVSYLSIVQSMADAERAFPQEEPRD